MQREAQLSGFRLAKQPPTVEPDWPFGQALVISLECSRAQILAATQNCGILGQSRRVLYGLLSCNVIPFMVTWFWQKRIRPMARAVGAGPTEPAESQLSAGLIQTRRRGEDDAIRFTQTA